MTIANVRGMVAKVMMVGLAAGALMVAAPTKADAQRFVVGVRVGDPYYAHPRGYEFDRRQELLRREEFARREAFLRHQEWERAHRFDRSYGYR